MKRTMDVYIYALVDPGDGQYRYIGQTTNPDRRLNQHIWSRETSPRGKWLTALRDAKMKPEMVILEVTTLDTANDAEFRWRDKYQDLLNVGLSTYNRGDTVNGRIDTYVSMKAYRILKAQALSLGYTLRKYCGLILEGYADGSNGLYAALHPKAKTK